MIRNINLINNLKLTYGEIDDIVKKISLHKNTEQYVIINFLYFANFVLSRFNKNYRQALLNSQIILPDGIGLISYTFLLYLKRIPNLNGTDLIPVLLKRLIKLYEYPIAFYGAQLESVQKAFEKFKSSFPTLYYFQNGYSDLDWSKIKDNSVIVVCLGTPKQEIWALNNLEVIKSKKLIVINGGGFFDFISGLQKRAPKYIRKLHLEWMYRLFSNPSKSNIDKNLRNVTWSFFLILDSIILCYLNLSKLLGRIKK